jgi:hypothetical protein
MRARCYGLNVEQRRSRSVPSTKADTDPRFLGKVTDDFRVTLAPTSTLTFALNFVKRPAEREKDRKWPATAFNTRKRQNMCVEKNQIYPVDNFRRLQKGWEENETRLCKCLKNVRLTAGDRKTTVSRDCQSRSCGERDGWFAKAARRKDDAEGSHSQL